MLLKTIFISVLTLVMIPPQAGQLSLPAELSESESQSILKEQRSRSRVEAALKLSDTRLNHAFEQAQASDFKTAALDIDVYAGIIRYADDYTRRLPSSQLKDRNHSLKKIEQAIFKQTRTLDALSREMPFNYHEAIERAIADVKKIRLRAINDLLGGGNIINSSN